MSPIHFLTDHIRLKNRFLLGALLAAAVIASLIALAILAFRQTTSEFQRFLVIGQESRIDLQMVAQMADIQRQTLIYTYEGHPSAASQVDFLYKDLLQQADAMLREGQPAIRPIVAIIKQRLVNYYDAFLLVRKQREAQQTLINTQFRDSASKAESLIRQMSGQSHRQLSLQLQLQETLNALLLVEKHLFRYLDSFDAQNLTIARESLDNARKQLDRISGPDLDPAMLRQARDLLGRYQQNLTEVIQRTRGYLYLVNVVIPAEANEILYQSRKLAGIVSSQMTDTEKSIFSNITLTNGRLLFLGLGLLTALLLIFFVISQSISRPIVRLAETFGRLARGDNSAHIPRYQLADEIGQLTQAAEAFRDKNAQTQGLLNNTLQLAEALRQSKSALEDSNSEIRDLNTTLEQKVEERTAELMAASAAKSQFLAQMSHELRTPMNAVIGFSQILEREGLNGDQQILVRQIRDSGNTLLGIINDILEFSKIEAGQLKIDPQPFELSSLLGHIEQMLRNAASDKGVVLAVKQPAELLDRLLGDRLRLEQVLLNLVGNAIKFTEQGRVDLEVRRLTEDDRILRFRFEVRDTGIGIDEDALARLFQPFVQADATINRRFGGTGLGLVISQRLLSLMQGELQVASEPGKGSVFWFELCFDRAPSAAEAPAISDSGQQFAKLPRLFGLRVLAVADSQINRMLVERALKLEGAHVTLASDGQQALEVLRTQHRDFDAVLMDIQMPIMDGLAATRVIRTDPQLAHLPVFALSAGVLAEEREAALEAGVNDFLSKPLDLDQMNALLEPFRSAPHAS